MGGDPTFFGSGAETTNLYLQHLKKEKEKEKKEGKKSLETSLPKEKQSWQYNIA